MSSSDSRTVRAQDLRPGHVIEWRGDLEVVDSVTPSGNGAGVCVLVTNTRTGTPNLVHHWPLEAQVTVPADDEADDTCGCGHPDCGAC